MKTARWYFVIASLLMLNGGFIQAEEFPSPNAILEDTANKMFDSLNKERSKIKADPTHTQKLVEEILMPNIDIITASKNVLGVNWDNANKDQKLRFLREFRTMLLRFYSSALSEYLNSHDEKLERSIMKFFPVNADKQKEVDVLSEVSPKTGKPVQIKYHMVLTNKGWKLFDVTVDGVSVITSYQTSFANDINQKGLDALIDSLVERNKKLLASGTKALAEGDKPPAPKAK